MRSSMDTGRGDSCWFPQPCHHTWVYLLGDATMSTSPLEHLAHGHPWAHSSFLLRDGGLQ